MWLADNTTSIQNIFGSLDLPRGLFITSNGDVYVDNGNTNHRIDKWISNATSSVTVTNITSSCYSLFIDNNSSLYCSNDQQHKVVKVSLTNASNIPTTIAGNGTQGSGPYMMSFPSGILVDNEFNLYVADCGNNRIQLFRSKQLNGTTIAGNISLSCPTGIALDADDYLFIVDHSNHRVIGSGPTGFRCLVGCSSVSGATADHLNYPRTLAFDSYGNLFILDSHNNRIQKFFLITNSCSKYNLIRF